MGRTEEANGAAVGPWSTAMVVAVGEEPSGVSGGEMDGAMLAGSGFGVDALVGADASYLVLVHRVGVEILAHGCANGGKEPVLAKP